MAQKARIIIELVYDLDEFYGEDSAAPGAELTPKEIHNDLEDRVYYDLSDLMRGDRLRSWSEIEIEEED
jgi:hypothetical protein